MPSETTTLLPHDPQPDQLLQYLPVYRVVVCSSCHYAVQPHAISRHLKDIHSIHRSHRRPFMQYVSSLLLDEPENVMQCLIKCFPVPLLPVQTGLRCALRDCSHLCVSVKRMQSHWINVHGRHGVATKDWHPAPLQTFFKGNLLQYFTEPTFDSFHNEYEIPSSIGSDKKKDNGHQNNSQILDPLECPANLNQTDNILLQHFVNSTCNTISTDGTTKELWQVIVPQLAESHPFLMHGILACAALHIAHSNPSERRAYLIIASSHQDLAMPMFRFAITNVNKENCDAAFVFSHLMVIYSFAVERQDELLLLVDANESDIMPSWLYFLRSGCSMMCSVWDSLEAGPVKTLVSTWDVPTNTRGDTQHSIVDSLLSMIPLHDSQDAWPEYICQIYREAADVLGWAFSCTGRTDAVFTAWDALRIWPMEVSVEYITLLSNQHPAALILLAHYCILLRPLETHWYFEGRATRLLGAVLPLLDQRWYRCIQLPLKEIQPSLKSQEQAL